MIPSTCQSEPLCPAADAAHFAASYGARPLDAAERERLLLEHLAEVRYIARRVHERLPPHVPLEDLVQAGVVGLIDALHRYDPAHHTQLATYARFRIRGAILDSLRALDWGPRELRRRGRELAQAQQTLADRLHRTPTEEEICAHLELTAEEYHRLNAALHSTQIEAASSSDDDDGASLLEAVPSPAPDPFLLCQRGEDRERLAAAIADLPERDQQILSLYYHEELTMKEVGAVLGIGESRVCQIHTALIARLRRRLQPAEPAPELTPEPSLPAPPPSTAAEHAKPPAKPTARAAKTAAGPSGPARRRATLPMPPGWR